MILIKIAIYDLEREGTLFRKDFDKFRIVERLFRGKNNRFFLKADLISNSEGRLFLSKRIVNFLENIGFFYIKEVDGFVRREDDFKKGIRN